MWVKLRAAIPSSANYGLINKGSGAGSGAGFTSYIWRLRETGGGNEINFAYSNNGSDFTERSATINIPANIWVHLAVSVTASTKEIKFYVNGREYSGTGTGTPTSIMDSSGAFVVGRDTLGSGTDRDFDGDMKDIRVFNDIRTQAEIIADAHSETVSDGNLVAEWNLNNALTSTTSNNTLVANASPVFGVSIPWESPSGAESTDYALNLVRASSQKAEITDAAQTGLDVGSAGTFMAWVNIRAFANNLVLLSKYGTGSNADQRSIQWWFQADGTMRIQLTSDGTVGTRVGDAITWTINRRVGEWFHIAWTFNAGTVEVFVDGVSIGTNATYNSTIFNSDSKFQVGTVADSDYFDGQIRDLRVFNDVRTQAEIISDARSSTVSNANLKGEWQFNNAYTDGSGGSNTLTATNSPTFKKWRNKVLGGAVSWWTMDEASGNRADSHGANTLTDNNTVASTAGKKSNAADFESGNSEYLSIADGSQSGLDVAGDISFSGWIYLESLTGDHFLVNKGQNSDSTQAYLLWIGSDGGMTIRFSDDGSSGGGHMLEASPAAGTFSTGNWYHIVISFRISTEELRLYINGKETALTISGTIGSSLYNSAGDLFIGARRNSGSVGSYFDGLIDELVVYARALDYGDVLDLYKEGNAITYAGATSVSTTPSNPLSITFSLPTPTVTAIQNATITPSALGIIFSIPAPTVTTDVSITPAAPLGIAFSLPTSEVQTPDAHVAPSQPLTITFALPSPTVTAIQNASFSPSPLTITFSLPVSTVTAVRDATVSPDPLILTFSMPVHTITGDFWQNRYPAAGAGSWNPKY